MPPARQIALFGLLGLLVSVLLAWIDTGSIWDRSRMRELPVPGVSPVVRARNLFSTIYVEHRTSLPPALPMPWPADPNEHAMDLAARDYPVRDPDATVRWPNNAKHTTWVAEFRGVPFRCLCGWWADGTFSGAAPTQMTSFIELPRGEYGPPWRLPVTPVWTGLLANTVFWGWLAFASWRLVSAEWRRLSRITPNDRRARGLCEKCEYPRAGIEGPCPECGHVSE